MITKIKASTKIGAEKDAIANYIADIMPALQKASHGDFSQKIESAAGQADFDELTQVLNDLIFYFKEKKVYLEDIVSQQQAVLKKNKGQIDRIIDFVPIAIFVVDSDEVLTYWNKKAENVTGYEAKEVVGKQFSDLSFFHFKNTLKNVSAGQSILKTKDDREIFIRKYIDYIKDEKGTPVSSIVTFEDITNENRRESERIKRQKDIEKMNQFMVGREIKVIEMKKEIQNLKDQLKKLKSIKNEHQK